MEIDDIGRGGEGAGWTFGRRMEKEVGRRQEEEEGSREKEGSRKEGVETMHHNDIKDRVNQGNKVNHDLGKNFAKHSNSTINYI